VISIRPSSPHAYINSNMYTRTPLRPMLLFQQRLHHYLGPHTSARACPDRQAHRRAPSVQRQIYKPLPFALLQERRAASPQGLRLSVLKKEDRKSVLRSPHAHATVGLGQVTQCSSLDLSTASGLFQDLFGVYVSRPAGRNLELRTTFALAVLQVGKLG
jgi:hypothetical protein